MPTHVVKQGECLSSIAKKYGFHWQTIWQHALNSELRSKRKDPNILYPGEIINIPEKEAGELVCSSGQCHVFKVKSLPKLRLRLLKNGTPRSNTDYVLDLQGLLTAGTTNADGILECSIPPDVETAMLLMENGAERYTLHLGHLDPVTETTGLKGRLKNLGLYHGPINDQLNDDIVRALKAFQRIKGLSETECLDEETQEALKKEHGS